MKIIDDREIFGIEDVKFLEEPMCEHCGDLEPFTATINSSCSWCLDCANVGDDFRMTREEWRAVNIQQQYMQLKYYIDKHMKLSKHLAKVISESDKSVMDILKRWE